MAAPRITTRGCVPTAVYRAVEDITNGATNPYAAAVAIEAWLRSSGGFTYDEHPPQEPGCRRSSDS